MEMPKILGVEAAEHASDDFVFYTYATPIGEVQIEQYSPYEIRMWRGQWYAAGANNRRFAIGLHTQPGVVATEVDAFLRALLAAAVEPIAADFDNKARHCANGDRETESRAWSYAANDVRTFYAEEPSR
jgi:hypothetical protein